MRVLITVFMLSLLSGCAAADAMIKFKPHNEYETQLGQYTYNWAGDYEEVTGESLSPPEWKQFGIDMDNHIKQNYADKPYAVWDGMAQYYESRLLMLKYKQKNKDSKWKHGPFWSLLCNSSLIRGIRWKC